MLAPDWLNELTRELGRRKLPSAYAARLVEELTDHVTDLMEERMSTDALGSGSVFDRLGAPQDVAHQAAVSFRNRTFCGRHPVLMFVVAPILAVPVAYIVGLLMALGFALVWKKLNPGVASYDMTPLQMAGLKLLCTTAQVVPIAGLAALVAWLAARSGVSRRWAIGACVLLGLIVGASSFDMFVSPLPQKSSITIGLGYHGWRTGLLQLARFAVPVGVGLWIFTRRMKTQTPALAS